MSESRLFDGHVEPGHVLDLGEISKGSIRPGSFPEPEAVKARRVAVAALCIAVFSALASLGSNLMVCWFCGGK